MGARGMNPIAMEKHPKQTPTGIGTSSSPGLASLASSSSALPAKQEAFDLTGFLANSFKKHSVIALCTRAVHKETELFFLNLLLYLQLNQTCLLQSTPLHS
jgi:hypothetical protein